MKSRGAVLAGMMLWSCVASAGEFGAIDLGELKKNAPQLPSVNGSIMTQEHRGASLLAESTDETYFQQLKKLYAQGGLPSKEELTGWFAGRCYDSDSPGHAKPSLVVGIQKKVGDDNGPLFPSNFEYRIDFVSGVDAPPDAFDDWTELVARSVEPVVDSDFYKLTTTTEVERALASKWGDLFEYRVRKYGAYFIGRVVLLKDYGELKAGDITMCYFFKKVR